MIGLKKLNTIAKAGIIGIIGILMFSVTTVIADDCNPDLTVPTGFMTMMVEDGENSWFTMYISGIPSGYNIENGTYLAWCLQQNVIMSRGVNHTVSIYSSYDPEMPEHFQDNNWSKINYLINHKQDYTRNSIQHAIWHFIDNYEYPTDPDAQVLIADVNENGEGYCPGVGDKVAILVDCVETIQRTIIELTVPEPDGDGEPSDGETPANHPPTADAYYGEPYEASAGEAITFDGSHSYDRDGSIVSWRWDFGDRTFGNAEIIDHIYVVEGKYNVSLMVTDDDGATDTYETLATISQANQPPTIPLVDGIIIGIKILIIIILSYQLI